MKILRGGKNVKKKKKWIKWTILIVIVALAACWLLFFSKTTQSAAYTKMQTVQGDMMTYYNFDGVVHAKRMQTVAATSADRVKTVYVSQNQMVSEGDKLYKTENGETVRAGIDGEITGLFVSEGSVVSAGEVTAQIIDMSDLEVRLNVDEYDVGAIVPGMPGTIAPTSYSSTLSRTSRSDMSMICAVTSPAETTLPSLTNRPVISPSMPARTVSPFSVL